MVWILIGLVGVLLVGAVAVLLTRQVPFDPMAEAVSSTPDTGLPTGDLSAADVDALRFDTALRGYRMDQVDDALTALQHRIAELEAQLRPAEATVPPSAAVEHPPVDPTSLDLGSPRERSYAADDRPDPGIPG